MTAHSGAGPKASLRSIAIVGHGRLGTALSKALRTNPNGFRLHSFIAARSADLRPLANDGGPEVLIIATRDSDIQKVARRTVTYLSRNEADNLKLIVHLAGSRSSTILPEVQGVRRLTLHPIQTFAKPNAKLFEAIWFAASSESKGAIRWSKQFVKALGATGTFELDDAGLPLYHAMLVIGANFITLLEAMVEDISLDLKLDPQEMKRAMAPLLRGSLENAIRMPALESLTGPIKRGDLSTIRAHKAALKTLRNRSHSREIISVYDALARYGLKRLRSEKRKS